MPVTDLEVITDIPTFSYSERKAGILSSMIMERIPDCGVFVDLQDQMVMLTNRGSSTTTKSSTVGTWMQNTITTMAIGPGVIFEPVSTNSIQAPLKEFIPEAVHALYSHIKPVDSLGHLSRYEQSIQFQNVYSNTGRSSGSVLAPT